MKILGINGCLNENQHNTSACLMIDGKIICEYEEERLNKIKHCQKFPYLSVEKCLTENGLTIDDIDIIAPSFCENDFYKLFPNCKKKPKWVLHSHHMGHICESFYKSGFDSAACLVIDGCGDCNDSITIAHIKNNKINILKKYNLLQSLGALYLMATSICNFGYNTEGKIMGLSSYGTPENIYALTWNDKNKNIDINYTDVDMDFINSFSNDNVMDNIIYLMKKYYIKNIYPYHQKENDNTDILHYINLASTIQQNFNDIYLNLVKYCKELTNEDNLVLSGGCIQNCIGNNLIVEQCIFKNVYASPCPHDGGCASGYALYASYLYDKIEKNKVTNSYGKCNYDYNGNHKIYNEDEIVQKLKNNKIIGWYQGGAELGPRALGHRSILANPSNRETFDIINNEIKHRENWRPLAPIIPEELFDIVFDVKSYDLTEFMLRTIPIKEEWKNRLPAICHIDGTTRPQRLVKKENPELYSLLMNFYKKTGIPCLVNTSLNDKEQPIIETPQEALDFLKNHTMMDNMIINVKYIVDRKDLNL